MRFIFVIVVLAVCGVRGDWFDNIVQQAKQHLDSASTYIADQYDKAAQEINDLPEMERLKARVDDAVKLLQDAKEHGNDFLNKHPELRDHLQSLEPHIEKLQNLSRSIQEGAEEDLPKLTDEWRKEAATLFEDTGNYIAAKRKQLGKYAVSSQPSYFIRSTYTFVSSLIPSLFLISILQR